MVVVVVVVAAASPRSVPLYRPRLASILQLLAGL